MVPIERALLRTVPWLLAGLLASLPLLVVEPGVQLSRIFLIHLGVLVGFGFGLSLVLVSLGTPDWFVATGWSRRIRLISGGIGLVVLTTGAVGLVTLASSAAIGFDPSTQFLQLISALDIAWVVASITLGAYRAWGRSTAVGLGLMVATVCVWSIWAYLDAVGFGPNGEWVVSSADLVRYVLPFDVIAALLAVAVFLVGVFRFDHATEQPRPQS